jgi:predicted O-methyltransferase YrrM
LTGGGSSIPEVQALLAVLANGRRVAEAGTAFGDGTKALAGTATSVVTVEIDAARVAAALQAVGDLPNVELVEGDWRTVLPERGPFGMVFLDSTFKKAPEEEGPIAIDLLLPGGLFVIDDLTPDYQGPDPAREFLFGSDRLQAVEVRTTASTSAIIASRR